MSLQKNKTSRATFTAQNEKVVENLGGDVVIRHIRKITKSLHKAITDVLFIMEQTCLYFNKRHVEGTKMFILPVKKQCILKSQKLLLNIIILMTSSFNGKYHELNSSISEPIRLIAYLALSKNDKHVLYPCDVVFTNLRKICITGVKLY